jgi:hypothetical protein
MTKIAMSMLSTLAAAAILGTIGWAWGAEQRLTRIEELESQVEKLENQTVLIQQNNTAIEVLKTELLYIKQGIADIKVLLAQPTHPSPRLAPPAAPAPGG